MPKSGQNKLIWEHFFVKKYEIWVVENQNFEQKWETCGFWHLLTLKEPENFKYHSKLVARTSWAASDITNLSILSDWSQIKPDRIWAEFGGISAQICIRLHNMAARRSHRPIFVIPRGHDIQFSPKSPDLFQTVDCSWLANIPRPNVIRDVAKMSGLVSCRCGSTFCGQMLSGYHQNVRIHPRLLASVLEWGYLQNVSDMEKNKVFLTNSLRISFLANIWENSIYFCYGT